MSRQSVHPTSSIWQQRAVNTLPTQQSLKSVGSLPEEWDMSTFHHCNRSQTFDHGTFYHNFTIATWIERTLQEQQVLQ